MTCKDCIHYMACKTMLESQYYIVDGGGKNADKLCKEFQNKDNFVDVVRCKDCWYYHKAHILCNDGTEKDISEFPKESIDFTGGFVTSKYGINMGGKCELEKNCGYAEDKSVFREPNDFCSRGQALKGGAE